MKILHWDEMFHPDFGYQINILPKFQVMQGHDVTIMSSDRIHQHPKFAGFSNSGNTDDADNVYTQKYGVRIKRVPWHMVVSGRVIYKRGFIGAIKREDPDIVMCHTNDTLSAMTIALRYRKLQVPLVFDNHMLDMASKNPMKKVFRLVFRHLITPLIIRNQWIVIRTQNDDYVNKHLGIPEHLTPFISFGSDTSLFYPSPDVRAEFRKKHDISDDDFVIVYTGKLDVAKGGMLLAGALRDKIDVSKNLTFVIVGNTEREYGEQVESNFSASENKIIRFPTQKYTDLPQFYQAADICVFARQASLSFFDAQACGLPAILEDNNINSERVSHKNGFIFTPGDAEDLRRRIEEAASMSNEKYKEMSENAYSFVKENYSYDKISNEYTKILLEQFNKAKR